MKPSLNILRGELERLFSVSAMDALCTRYFCVDAQEIGIHDENKANFARQIVEYCDRMDASEALADAVSIEKMGMTDPRLKHVYAAGMAQTINRNEIDGYTVQDKLGSDDAYTLYACESTGDDDSDLVLMVVNRQHALNRAAVQRFLVTCRILADMDADFVPQIKMISMLSDGRPFLILGSPTGARLSDMTNVSVDTALTVVDALLGVLERLSDAGLLFGDIRSPNIWVKEDDNSHLTCLGIGFDKLLGSAGWLKGNRMARVIAPEVLRGEAPTVASELYALGCVLFELLTGKSPFAGRRAIDIAAEHLSATHLSLEAQFDGELAPKLNALVEGLLARDVSGRITEFATARRALEEARQNVEDMAKRAEQSGTREDIEEQLGALADDPANTEALSALWDAAELYKAYGPAAAGVAEIVEHVSDSQLAFSLMLQAAQLAAEKARDYALALELYEQLAGADPEHVGVFDARLSLYRKRGNYEAVVEMLGARAEVAESETDKRQLLLEIADVFKARLGEPGKAFDYYMACISGSDADKEIVEKLETIALQEGRLPELVEAAGNAAGVVEEAGNRDMALFYYGKLGHWYLMNMQQPAVALTCYQKVLQIDPTDEKSFDALTGMYRNAQQWLELCQVYNQRIETETIPETRRDLQVETAKIYFERMGEIDGAKAIVDNVLTDDPGCVSAIALRRKICEKTEDYNGLVEVLCDSVDAMPTGDERVEQRAKLAEIYELHLKDTREAARHYNQAIQENPEHWESLKGLERVYAMTEDFGALRDVLEKQLAVAATPKQKIGLLERLATMYDEEFKDLEKTIECWRRVTEIDDEHGGALLALTRALKKNESFEELASVLNRRAQIADTAQEKVALLAERADILMSKLNDDEGAGEAYAELASVATDRTLIEKAIRVLVELRQFDQVDAAYGRLLASLDEADDRINVLVEQAAFRVEKMNDIQGAEDILAEAKEIAPNHPGVIAELADVLSAKGDYAGALELLETRIELAEGSGARAKIYAQMGVISLDKIGDKEKAVRYFEHAVDIDTSNMVASDRLAGLYREQEKWDKAIVIYERWVPSASALGPDAQLELFNGAAEAYEKVGRTDKALALFKKAAELAEDPRLLRRLADVALERKEWELADSQYKRYMALVGTDIDADEKVQIFINRGVALMGGEKYDEAAKMARQATVMSPDDVNARILLADVHEARHDYRGAVEARNKVLESLDTSDERWLGIVRNTASIMFEKLKNADGAAQLLNEALENSPDSRDLLGELLKMYYAAKKYKDVVNVILRIVEHVTDDAQLAKYYLTVAKIYRRELKDPDNAAMYFTRVLEHDASFTDARDALIDVLTESRNWEGLEKAYKGLIARLPSDASDADKLEWYKPLAELYMTKLDKESDAIMLYEAISDMEPKELKWKEKLSELYSWNTKYADKATDLHRGLLRVNLAKVDSIRMLFRIFSAQQEADKSWCAAALLSLVNQASPEERQYYKDYLSEGYPPISDSIDDEMWTRKLYHADMNLDISRIFSVVMPAIAAARCKSPEQVGLDIANAVDFTTDPSAFCELANFGFGVAGIAPVPLFFQSDQSGLGLVETNPPVMIAGGDAAEMRDYLGLAFLLGKQLTMLRPGLFARQILKSGTEMSTWLLASLKVFVPQLPVPNNLIGGVNEKLGPIRNSLSAEDKEKLEGYVQSFVGQAADVDLKRWAQSVGYTGDRVGLLLCGDIGVASRMIETTSEDEKEKARRFRELSLFTLSDNYFDVRKKLGVAI